MTTISSSTYLPTYLCILSSLIVSDMIYLFVCLCLSIYLTTYYTQIGGGATAGTERGYPEPFGLLEPPAQNPGCCCAVG